MTYTTTNHPFIIDDKHPTDVFDEMANFFSLYTVALDNLNRMSLQLVVPADFDIDGNQKLHDSYQQFIKTVLYSVPDINVLPIKTAESDSQTDKITLMIQTFAGRITDETAIENGEPKPKFYQKLLGGLLPKFASETTQEGLYPEQIAPAMTMPEPIPIMQPTPAPPIATPQVQPQPVPAQPVSTQPSVQPVVTPQPIPQQPPLSTPSTMPRTIPTPSNTYQALPKILLPKPSKSIRPYRELLTQAIIKQAQMATSDQANQSITAITFKSRDSLTTAFIETVFASFSPAQNGLGRAGDAIDLPALG